MRFGRFLALTVLALAACDDVTKTDFPVLPDPQDAEVEELAANVTIIPISADNIGNYDFERSFSGGKTTLPVTDGWNYRVGVGDILDIVVWDHPELTLPAGELRSPQESGLRVQSDGTFFYPYVGQVEALGLSPETIRENLSLKLAEFIPDPQIEVRVVEYNSQSVSVTGQVNAPARLPLTGVQLTLLQAIDAAGGLTEGADTGRVSVRRGGKVYDVNLQAFLDNGLSTNNPILFSGDVVNVPQVERAEAYLLGQIVQPATVDLTREDVSLTQAITRTGGLDEDNADARGVFVFRETRDGINVFQFDVSNPLAYLLGTDFTLLPQDVVYVTTAPLSRWNRLISQLLPTITSVRTVDQINGG